MRTIAIGVVFLWAMTSTNAQNGPKITVIDDETPIVDYSLPDDGDSQKDVEGIISILDIMNVEYHKPDGFSYHNDIECFKNYWTLEEMLKCLQNQLLSDDGEFFVFISMFEPFTEQDTLYIEHMKKYYPVDGPLCVLDMQHISNVKTKVIYSLGYGYDYFLNKRNDVDWRQYLNYYPQNKAEKIFNADTAIRYSINLNPEDYYKGKYNNLESLVLQKRGRGFIEIFCFYTDKAEKKLSYYWNKIEGIFRYKD